MFHMPVVPRPFFLHRCIMPERRMLLRPRPKQDPSKLKLEGASAASQQASINPSVTKKLIQLHWGKDKAADGAKINPDAVVLATEYLRLFVIEAHERAQLEAELDNDETLEPHHIERVMLGMLLDF